MDIRKATLLRSFKIILGGVVNKSNHVALVIHGDQSHASGYDILNIGVMVWIKVGFSDLDSKCYLQANLGKLAPCALKNSQNLLGQLCLVGNLTFNPGHCGVVRSVIRI